MADGTTDTQELWPQLLQVIKERMRLRTRHLSEEIQGGHQDQHAAGGQPACRLDTDQCLPGPGSGDDLRPEAVGRHTAAGEVGKRPDNGINGLDLMRTQRHMRHPNIFHQHLTGAQPAAPCRLRRRRRPHRESRPALPCPGPVRARSPGPGQRHRLHRSVRQH